MLPIQVLAWADVNDPSDMELANSVVRWTTMLPLAIAAHVTQLPEWHKHAEVIDAV